MYKLVLDAARADIVEQIAEAAAGKLRRDERKAAGYPAGFCGAMPPEKPDRGGRPV